MIGSEALVDCSLSKSGEAKERVGRMHDAARSRQRQRASLA